MVMTYSIKAVALVAILVDFAQATGPRGCEGGTCSVTEEVDAPGVSLLMHSASRLKKGQERQSPSPSGSSVQCFFFPTGQYGSDYCTANSCCQAMPASGGRTYPCQASSADAAAASGCQTTNWYNLLQTKNESDAAGVSLLAHAASGLTEGQQQAELFQDAQKRDQKQNSTQLNCYDGTACSGNQCCPGVESTGLQTYPCPTASAGFSGCQTPYGPSGRNPMPYPTPSPSPGPSWCTYGNTQCAGDQCCPAVAQTGWKTYPCPSNPYFNGCGGSGSPMPTPYPSPYPNYPSPSPYPYRPSPSRSSVQCYYYPTGTYGSDYCTANSCCQGMSESQWKTYPCYTSSAGFRGCQTTNLKSLLQTKNESDAAGVSLLTHAASGVTQGQRQAELSQDVQKQDQKQNSTQLNCYDGTACSGNQCCPGVESTGFQTYPCPTASAGFNGCQTPYGPSGRNPMPYPTPSPSPGPTWCTYGSTQCAGDQCCPAVAQTGWKTYPCPSNPYCNGCGGSGVPSPNPSPYPYYPSPSPYPYRPSPSSSRSSVQCYYYPTGTYGSDYCTANSCCQSMSESQWKTYPCYTSSAGFRGCQTTNLKSLLQAKNATGP